MFCAESLAVDIPSDGYGILDTVGDEVFALAAPGPAVMDIDADTAGPAQAEQQVVIPAGARKAVEEDNAGPRRCVAAVRQHDFTIDMIPVHLDVKGCIVSVSLTVFVRGVPEQIFGTETLVVHIDSSVVMPTL